MLFRYRKDIIIQSFGHKIYDTFIVSLIKQDLLMIDTGYEYFTINLKNHNKKKDKIDILTEEIIPLNDKQFIAAGRFDMKQFEIENDNKFREIYFIRLDNYKTNKYSKNRFVFVDEFSEKGVILYLFG